MAERMTADVDIAMPASMLIRNNDAKIIGEGVIDMHGVLRVKLDFSHEANEWLQYATLSDRYEPTFSMIIGFKPIPATEMKKRYDEVLPSV